MTKSTLGKSHSDIGLVFTTNTTVSSHAVAPVAPTGGVSFLGTNRVTIKAPKSPTTPRPAAPKPSSPEILR